jgi:dienelactone hydrolase
MSFVQQVRARGQRPVVILLQDRGSGTDSLARMIGPSLVRAGAIVIRSDLIANPNDPRNFLPDGHFTPEVDRAIARKLLVEVNN